MTARLKSATAPDFVLNDTRGRAVRLSDYRGTKHVVLVFNRGFAWPFCRAHMAQLRQDYPQFIDRGTEVVVVGPDDERAFIDYWQKESLPFVGLADPTHAVANRYGQEVSLLKLGRMPALMVIDRRGEVRYKHYGGSMADIPPNAEILAVLDDLNRDAD